MSVACWEIGDTPRTESNHPRAVNAAPVILTARLALRPFTNADLDAVHALWTDVDMRRYLCDNRIVSIDESREWLEGSTREFAARGFGLLAS